MRLKENMIYYIAAAVVTSGLGLLLRYIYYLFPGVIIGIFAPTNASIFEQLKMLLWPTVLFMAIHEWIFKSGDFEGHCAYLLFSLIIVSAISLPFIGSSHSKLSFLFTIAVNVGIIVFFSFCYFSRQKTRPRSVFEKVASPILMISIITLFIAFSFNPPKWDFFADPYTGRFGIDL